MPLYDYKCRACGHAAEEFFKITSDPQQPCPECGGPWSYERQVSLPHTSQKEFSTPIEMHSIACNDMKEIREMQRAGVTISDDTADDLFGVPIAHSRHEKLRALKVAGYEEKG